MDSCGSCFPFPRCVVPVLRGSGRGEEPSVEHVLRLIQSFEDIALGCQGHFCLGQHPRDSLGRLWLKITSEGGVRLIPCLWGFTHPSGANGHRRSAHAKDCRATLCVIRNRRPPIRGRACSCIFDDVVCLIVNANHSVVCAAAEFRVVGAGEYPPIHICARMATQ